MSNVLSEEKKQQVIALGRLGWSLRRIERETGIRRETISAYLKEAGVELRLPRGRRLASAKPASAADAVTTDSASAKPACEVTPDSGAVAEPPAREAEPFRSPSVSLCEPFHELIEAGLARGRNAVGIWQDLVDRSGFAGAYASVKRYIRKLRGAQPPEPRDVILTAPGEEAQLDYGDGPMALKRRVAIQSRRSTGAPGCS